MIKGKIVLCIATSANINNVESIWTPHGNRRVSLGGVSEEILSRIFHAQGRIFWQFYVLRLSARDLTISLFLFIY